MAMTEIEKATSALLTQLLALWTVSQDDVAAIDTLNSSYFAGDLEVDEEAALPLLSDWRRCLLAWSKRPECSIEALWACASATPSDNAGESSDGANQGSSSRRSLQARSDDSAESSHVAPQRALLVVLYKCMLLADSGRERCVIANTRRSMYCKCFIYRSVDVWSPVSNELGVYRVVSMFYVPLVQLSHRPATEASQADSSTTNGSNSSSSSAWQRAPTSLAWEAAQAYLSMLRVPGAVAFGAFHPALMGQCLSCLRQWCKLSPLHKSTTAVKDGASRYRCDCFQYVHAYVLGVDC